MKHSDERQFLHTLATPISTAILLADTLLERCNQTLEFGEQEAAQLASLASALESLRKFVKARQEKLAADV